MKRGKILQALQALKKGTKIDPSVSTPALFSRIVNFAQNGVNELNGKEGVVRDIVVSELGALLSNKSIGDFVAEKRKSIDQDVNVLMR